MSQKQVEATREILEWYVKGLQFDPVDLLSVTVIPGENSEDIHCLRETTIRLWEDIERHALPYFLSLIKKLDSMPEQVINQRNVISDKVAKKRPRKPVEHMHRCPICDRMRKAVRLNVGKIRIQLEQTKRGESPASGWAAADVHRAFLEHLYFIEQAIGPWQVRNLQKLNDEEVDDYILANLVNNKWEPIRHPEAEEQSNRPRLTLIQGGLA